MTDRVLDVSYTVKASERDGRRLLKRVDTGEIFWTESYRDVEPIIDYTPAKDLKVAPKRKRRKSEEGDK